MFISTQDFIILSLPPHISKGVLLTVAN